MSMHLYKTLLRMKGMVAKIVNSFLVWLQQQATYEDFIIARNTWIAQLKLINIDRRKRILELEKSLCSNNDTMKTLTTKIEDLRRSLESDVELIDKAHHFLSEKDFEINRLRNITESEDILRRNLQTRITQKDKEIIALKDEKVLDNILKKLSLANEALNFQYTAWLNELETNRNTEISKMTNNKCTSEEINSRKLEWEKHIEAFKKKWEDIMKMLNIS